MTCLLRCRMVLLHRLAVLLEVGLLLGACSCINTSGNAATESSGRIKEGPTVSAPTPNRAPASTSKALGGRVALDWQQVMLDKLAKDPGGYQEAWGLFSEGGWANAGQVMVYGDAKSTSWRAIVVEPEADRISTDQVLSAAAFAPIAKAAKAAASLVDLDMVALDALTFEYVHVQKDGSGNFKVVKRVFIRNGGKKDTREYDALIAAFQQLRGVAK